MGILNKSKTYQEMPLDEKLKVFKYLTTEMWDKNKSSITCPLCGGTITTTEYGNSSVTECSTPGCVHITARGL